MRVSVIIPAYNAEDTIENALESLRQQTCKELEVIVVNDGSVDSTSEKVKTYSSVYTDLRVKLISQENGGVAAARNRGLQEATAEYIAFLDADDVYRKDAIEILLYLADKHSADTVIAGYTRDKKELELREEVTEQVILPQKAMEVWMYNNPPRVFCSILYSRRIIGEHNIVFPEGTKYGEDLEFTWNYLVHTQKAICINNKLYCYIDNKKSAVHQVTWEKTSLLESTKRIGNMLTSYDYEFATLFQKYMYPRTVWAVARAFAKARQYELLLRLDKQYNVRKMMKELIIAILYKTKMYKGELIKKVIIVISSSIYLIHPRLFYFFITFI